MLANQIMTLRKASGMSQSQLAKKLNIGPSAVGMYEQGRRTPSVDILIQMANVFEVSLDYLVTGRETVKSLTDEEVGITQLACPCMACPFSCHKRNLQRTNHCGTENMKY